MNDETRKYLLDVLMACDEVAQFVAGKTRADFDADVMLRRAVERNMEIMGEALNQMRSIDSSTVERVPDAHRIIGMRHRLIHAYSNVDENILWLAATKEAPLLRDAVDRLLAE